MSQLYYIYFVPRARMRALTLKKLNRLFLANDRMDAVPVPARMSLTDWLMFDLVLVHQKIDLIGQVIMFLIV